MLYQALIGKIKKMYRAFHCLSDILSDSFSSFFCSHTFQFSHWNQLTSTFQLLYIFLTMIFLIFKRVENHQKCFKIHTATDRVNCLTETNFLPCNKIKRIYSVPCNLFHLNAIIFLGGITHMKFNAGSKIYVQNAF